MKNIVFMGSKPVGYYCFENLIKNKENYRINIIGLFTKHRTEFAGKNDLSILAEENQIPIYDDLDDLLSIDSVDIIISVQYHKILKKHHINRAKEIAINLHMAPLPEYRGSNQFSFAIINGDTVFGTTIHKLEESIDGGPIICEQKFDIAKDISVEKLYDLTVVHSIKIFEENIFNIISGKYELLQQSTQCGVRNESFHLRKEINDIKKIDLRWDEEKIEKYIRATSMPGFDPPYTIIKGQKIYLVNQELYSRIK